MSRKGSLAGIAVDPTREHLLTLLGQTEQGVQAGEDRALAMIAGYEPFEGI